MRKDVVPDCPKANGDHFGEEVEDPKPEERVGNREIENNGTTIDDGELHDLLSVLEIPVLKREVFVREKDKADRKECGEDEPHPWIHTKDFHKDCEGSKINGGADQSTQCEFAKLAHVQTNRRA